MNIFEQIRLHQVENDWRPEPAELPTNYLPGTRGKLMVLVWRIEHGQELWHPEDPIVYHKNSDSGLVDSSQQNRVRRRYARDRRAIE